MLLLLGACAYVDPSLTDQTEIITDAETRRSDLVVAVAPKAKSRKPLTALFYPFHIQQPTPDHKHLGRTFGQIFQNEWLRRRLFTTLEMDPQLTYYNKRRSLAEARRRGADLLILGFVPYFYAGSTLDDTAMTLQVNIYNVETGILLFSMAQSGRIEERIEEDWIYFRHRTRMSDSPFFRLVTDIAADMAVPVKSWLPDPDARPYSFAGNKGQIVTALTTPTPPNASQQDDASGGSYSDTANGSGDSSTGMSDTPDNSGVQSQNGEDSAMERDLTQSGKDVPGVNLDIRFNLDKATIRPESYPLLDELARALKTPELKGKPIIVAGHTDSSASQRYNLTLSAKRADSVKKYLVMKHAIPPELIETVGYGESRPIADNDTEQGRMKNRRVEVRLAE